MVFIILTIVGEEKEFSLYPSEFFAETPIIKDRVIREKWKFIGTYASWIHERYPGKNE